MIRTFFRDAPGKNRCSSKKNRDAPGIVLGDEEKIVSIRTKIAGNQTQIAEVLKKNKAQNPSNPSISNPWPVSDSDHSTLQTHISLLLSGRSFFSFARLV